MKVLLDTCVWGGALATLREGGHETDWSGAWAKDPGDREILAIAYRNGQVIVTLDKDFGELVMVHGLPHAGLVRLVGIPAREQGALAMEVIERYEDLLVRGAILTVSSDRIQVRPPN